MPSPTSIERNKVGVIAQPASATLDLLYTHTVLIVPDLWQYCECNARNLYDYHKRFGHPWARNDYHASMEFGALMRLVDITQYIDGGYAGLSKANDLEIPWHSDVPIYHEKHLNWPIRSLTAWHLPENPTTSSFCSTYALYDCLSTEEKAFAERVTLTYQSWHKPGTCFTEMPLVQSHPVTGRKFLALNSYNQGKNGQATRRWIVMAHVKGEAIDSRDCRDILGRYEEAIEDLSYSHHWEHGHMVVFDNTGLLHRRDKGIDPANPRKFFRMNLRHNHQMAPFT